MAINPCWTLQTCKLEQALPHPALSSLLLPCESDFLDFIKFRIFLADYFYFSLFGPISFYDLNIWLCPLLGDDYDRFFAFPFLEVKCGCWKVLAWFMTV
jgi:hypothetical protein